MKLIVQKVHNGKVAVEITQVINTFQDYVSFLDYFGIVAETSDSAKVQFAIAVSEDHTETYRVPVVEMGHA